MWELQAHRNDYGKMESWYYRSSRPTLDSTVIWCGGCGGGLDYDDRGGDGDGNKPRLINILKQILSLPGLKIWIP